MSVRTWKEGPCGVFNSCENEYGRRKCFVGWYVNGLVAQNSRNFLSSHGFMQYGELYVCLVCYEWYVGYSQKCALRLLFFHYFLGCFVEAS